MRKLNSILVLQDKLSRKIIMKLIDDVPTRKLLGAEIVRTGVADKRIDIIATALTFGATVDQISKLNKSKEIITYCRAGLRAAQAYRILKNAEFKCIGISKLPQSHEITNRRQETAPTLIV